MRQTFEHQGFAPNILLDLYGQNRQNDVYCILVEYCQYVVALMYLSTRKAGGETYLYLMESVYDSKTKKCTKKIKERFGRFEEFKTNHPKEYEDLVNKYGKTKEKYKAERDETFKRLFGSEEITSKNIKSLIPQNYSHLALRKLWNDELQMSKYFKYLIDHNNLGIEYDISDISLYYSALKLSNPMSYLAGLEESPRYLGDPMSAYHSDDVYRCLQLLSEHKDSIMRHVNSRIDELVPRKRSLIFYDCTNCYFETPYNDIYWYKKKARRVLRRILRKENTNFSKLSDEELNKAIDNDSVLRDLLEQIFDSFGEPLRMHGVSKEKRADLPIVSIALVIDENAFPIDFQIFAGNQAETSTMIDSVKKLKNKYKIKDAILVADSALNGTKNLCKLLEEGLGFSVAKSALSFSKQVREQTLDLASFAHIKDEAEHDTPVLYKIVPFDNTFYDLKEKDGNGKSKKYTINCNLMITFSENRKMRDLAVLEENINRAKLAIQRHEKINSAKGGWKQIVLTTLPETETTKSNTEEKSKSGNELNAISFESEQSSTPITSESLSSNNGKSTDVPERKSEIDTSSSNITDAQQSSATTSSEEITQDKKSETMVKKEDSSKSKKEKQKSANICIASSLNEDIIQKRKACAGFAGILYHEPPGTEDKFKPSYVSSLYHHLVQIEECFRVMKNDFEIRPIYLRERQSITGHVLLCVLSLIMLRLIQKKYKDHEKSITAEKLRSLLSEMKLMSFGLDEERCVYIRSEEIKRRNCMRGNKQTDDNNNNSEQSELLNFLMGENLDYVSTIEQLRKKFKLRSLSRTEYQQQYQQICV